MAIGACWAPAKASARPVRPEPPPLAPPARPAFRHRRRASPERIAVALHDIEPATFERCALIRDWLDDHGVDRVTLLVIPARDLHPVGERSPAMTSWLLERSRAGDSIAQHGFQHQQGSRGRSGRRALVHGPGSHCAEFLGLDQGETRRAVHAGWRVLKLAGIEPDGFVAPAYVYTRALREVLAHRFRWWAGLWRLHGPGSAAGAAPRRLLAPAWGLGGDSALGRALSPGLIRAGSLLCGGTLRVDVHPADLEHARHMLALEWVLGRAGHRREAITYGELLGAGR
jgi:predicted deacetylase